MTDRQRALRVAQLRVLPEAVAEPVPRVLIRAAGVLRVRGAVRLRREALLRVQGADGRRRVAVQRQQPGAQPRRLQGHSKHSVGVLANSMGRRAMHVLTPV